MQREAKKERIALWLGCGIALGFIFFAVFATYNNDSSTARSIYESVLNKKKALEQIRFHLLKSVEMEKNAVMALTDQESLEYANHSRAALTTVEERLTAFRLLLDAHPVANEKRLLEDFGGCLTELGKMDQIILSLAVENTNLKAAKLSRESGASSMERFEQALDKLRGAAEGKPYADQVGSNVSRAMIAGLKLYTLHSPHIAEAENAAMDRLEERMHVEQETVERSLAALTAIADNEHGEALAQAKTAFADFMKVTTQVVQLSRHNSNIKSLELSMGKKRLIAAKCDETLTLLQETVLNTMPKSTK